VGRTRGKSIGEWQMPASVGCCPKRDQEMSC
jgi:hypothetical protein